MRSTIPGAAGITETHLHRSDLFYVQFVLLTTLRIPMSPANRTIYPYQDGTVIYDFTLSQDGKRA